MDTLAPEQRSALMARIHSKDTKPELIIRKLVFGLGYRYRLHSKTLPGKPDIVFKSMKKIIFVNGCFWHGHRCPLGRMPKSRTTFWQEKIAKNNARDKEQVSLLEAKGWEVLTIWECELKDIDLVKQSIQKFLGYRMENLNDIKYENPNVQKQNLIKKKANTKKHSVVSFFSGCGGLDLGFLGGFKYKSEQLKKLPFEIVAAYDFDEKCISTYKENINDNAYVLDLAKVKSKTFPAAEVLIGGFPCQDFSSCGPKRGLTSQRGRLYGALVNYMKEHKPKVVVAENVPHLAKMRNGEVIEVILKDLCDAGYRFEVWNLLAPDYGIPQNRSRLFFIGVRNDIEGKPMMPIAHYKSNHRSIEWAIKDLEHIEDESIPNQSQYFKANKAKKGNGQGDETNRADQPSYTIRANAKSRVQFHYKLPRRLTVRECARIQTFPDNFSFSFSATTNIMQIGNAVPPLLAYRVASSIAKFLENVDKEVK